MNQNFIKRGLSASGRLRRLNLEPNRSNLLHLSNREHLLLLINLLISKELHAPPGAAKPRHIKFWLNRPKFYRGFTLLEVMVSLAIITTAFAAVLSLHSDSMEMIISSRIHTRAAELAQYKMTEIEISGVNKIAFMSGEFGDVAPGYSWDILIEPTPLESWVKVIVTVRNRNIREGGAFQLTEYMFIK